MIIFSLICNFASWISFVSGLQNTKSINLLSLISFHQLIPQSFFNSTPLLIIAILGWLMLGLVLRRAYLVFVKKSGIPISYKGFAKLLGYLAVIFFVPGALIMIFTFITKSTTLGPLVLLLVPAQFFIPWSFFLTEVVSFQTSKVE